MSIHIVGKLWLPKDEKWFIKVDVDSNSCLANLRWHGLLGSLSFVAAASTDLAGVTPATSPMVDRYSTNSAIGGRISLSTKCNVSSFRDQTPGEGQFCQQQPLSRGNDALALWTGRSGQPLLTNGELPKFETGQTKPISFPLRIQLSTNQFKTPC